MSQTILLLEKESLNLIGYFLTWLQCKTTKKMLLQLTMYSGSQHLYKEICIN